MPAMAKRPFIKKMKRKRHGASFWDFEYTEGGHLKLSEAPAGDLLKFCRWLERQKDADVLNPGNSVTDFGCGNGRNLIYLAETFGMRGYGFDISQAAIKIANQASRPYKLQYDARSIAGTFPTIADESQSLVLDMMSSHFLSTKERVVLREEMYRILKPGGYIFFKTHLGDGDLHTKRLLADVPAKEPQTYMHPVMGVPEYVYFEKDIEEFLEPQFEIMKVYRSHKHLSKGQARKRRTISVYVRKPLW